MSTLVWKIMTIKESPHLDQENVIKKLMTEHIKKSRNLDVYECPILEKTLNGETTFTKEYQKLGLNIYKEPGIFAIFPGTYDLTEESKLLDDIIKEYF